MKTPRVTLKKIFFVFMALLMCTSIHADTLKYKQGEYTLIAKSLKKGLSEDGLPEIVYEKVFIGKMLIKEKNGQCVKSSVTFSSTEMTVIKTDLGTLQRPKLITVSEIVPCPIEN